MTGGDADVYAHAKSDGSDIRVCLDASGTNFCTGQLQYYYTSGGKAYFDYVFNYDPVTYPSPSIRLYYGNALASSADTTAAWDSNTLVSFSPTQDGSTYNALDVGQSGRMLTNSSPTPTLDAGRIGKAFSLDGTSNYVLVDHTGFPISNAPVSMSAWLKPTGGTGWVCGPTIGNANQSNQSFTIWDHNGSDCVCGVQSHQLYNYGFFSNGTWAHVAVTYDGTYQRLYCNGSLVGGPDSQTLNLPNNTSNYTGLGKNAEYPDPFWYGLISQAVFSSVARSTAWVALDYNIVNGWATGSISLGSEQSVGGGGFDPSASAWQPQTPDQFSNPLYFVAT
jgi:hypothetical protein